MHISAASRHCRSLSSFFKKTADGSTRQKGQELIFAERNKTNSREMLYRLTPKTEELITEFMSKIVGPV
jgi:hypothetical protein